MKPDGALQTDMEDTEMEPHELFLQLGMLVVESRLPDLSPKGRRQGPHCPLVLGEPNWHMCDLQAYYCRRARTMQKEMQTLWKNRVPMCIEVTLLPDCYHGAARVAGNDVSLPMDKDGSLLLEQWTIQVLPKRSADNPVSVKVLFQAVQSHLYFSQLSAWLNRSCGKSPRNISYRISPPGDFCTSSFSQNPVCHTFPVAAISKTLSICVTARCLPRMHDVPHIRCLESHSTEPSALGATGGASPESSERNAASSQTSNDKLTSAARLKHESPRFQKPRVLREHPADGKPGLHSQDECTAQDTKMVAEYSGASRSPFNSSPLVKRRTSPPPPAKHTGAIPKRLPCKSPPPTFYDSDCASSAPELDLVTRCQEEHDAKCRPSTSDGSSPKVIITQKIPTQVYYGKEKVNWILKNVMNNGSSTDSDSSSPDIDRYLNKTLANRLEPLSPAEMEDYLETLCTMPSRGKKGCDNQNSGEFNYAYANHRCEIQQLPSLENLTTVSHKNTKDVTLSSINASFSNLVLNGEMDFSLKQNYASSKSKAYQQMASKSCQTQPSHSLLKHKEKSHSLQEPTPGSKLSQSGSLSLPYRHDVVGDDDDDDPVKFTLAEDDLVVAKKEYSERSHSSCQHTPTDDCCSVKDAFRPEHDQLQNGCSSLDTTESNPDRNVTNDTSQKLLSSHASSSKKNVFHKSVSCPGSDGNKGFTLPAQNVSVKANSLLKSVMRKELSQNDQYKCSEAIQKNGAIPIPTNFDRVQFQKSLNSSASMIFHAATGLPLQSSPAPTKKRTGDNFEYDASLTSPRAIKNSLSCVNLDTQEDPDNSKTEGNRNQRLYSTSAPASTNCLLGNFEESMLNGRLEPSGVVDGFTADIGASGSFCPKHVTIPVTAFFFSLSDDNAPSPYLGHINLDSLGKRGYHIPKKGTVQVTLFNPNKTVVKMFVVVYDMSNMPADCQTFLRQRTLYMPIEGSASDIPGAPIYLRYLIHLRFSSSKSKKIYLHTDIRLIFARDKLEFDSRMANYELRSFTEGPTNPTFSPKR